MMTNNTIFFGGCECTCGNEVIIDPNDDDAWGSAKASELGFVGWLQKFPFGSEPFYRVDPTGPPKPDLGFRYEDFFKKVPAPYLKDLNQPTYQPSTFDGYLSNGLIQIYPRWTIGVQIGWNGLACESDYLTFPACNALYIEITPNEVLANQGFTILAKRRESLPYEQVMVWEDQSDLAIRDRAYSAPVKKIRRIRQLIQTPGLGVNPFQIAIATRADLYGVLGSPINAGFQCRIRIAFISTPDPVNHPSNILDW